MDFELPQDVRVRSASVAEQIVANLRRLLVEGSMTPVARLREAQLAAGFGVSRQTVREAIRQLVHDGLVRHDRHRGAVVVDLDQHDVADIYAVRRTLELAGIERLADPADEALAEVERGFDRLAAAAGDGDCAAVVDADIAFHRSVTALAASPRLVRSFDMIAGELAFWLSVLRHVAREDRAPTATSAEHARIARAVVRRDVAAAGRLLSEHLGLHPERLARALVEREDAAARA